MRPYAHQSLISQVRKDAFVYPRCCVLAHVTVLYIGWTTLNGKCLLSWTIKSGLENPRPHRNLLFLILHLNPQREPANGAPSSIR